MTIHSPYSESEIRNPPPNNGRFRLKGLNALTDQPIADGVDLTRVELVAKKIIQLTLNLQDLSRQLATEMNTSRTDISLLDSDVIQAGNLNLVSSTFEAFVDNKLVLLTPLEFRLLRALVSQSPSFVSLDDLSLVGTGKKSGSVKNMKVYVGRLRGKLNSDSVVWTGRIESKRGVGYRVVL